MPAYNGTNSADTFTAPDDQDWVINGLNSSDILTGAGGNDTITGGKGNDTLIGNAGNDIFLFAKNDGFDSVDGGIGYDIVKATTDDATIGFETITGIEEISADGHLNVTISGTANDNVFDFSAVLLNGIGLIFGGAGNDTIIGNADANVIDGGRGDDTLIGGDGDDTFLVGGASGFDIYNGGNGVDRIVASANNATIAGTLIGIEIISGGTFSNVTIAGTAGDDIMSFAKLTLDNIFEIDAGKGNDTLTGSVGDDTLRGGDGDDIINGGKGNDTLYGDLGHDILMGGAGDDSFYISTGADVYNGGSGYDVVYANRNGTNLQIDTGILSGIEEISANGFTGFKISGANPDGSTIDLRRILLTEDDVTRIDGTSAADTIYGSKIYDYIYGGNGDDYINGFFGDDILHGGGGNDTILGGNGYDEIHGDGGDDIIDGGTQDDIIDGGAGDDIILVSSSSGYDTIDGGKGFDTIQAAEGAKIMRMASFVNIEAISWDGTHEAQVVGSANADSFDFSNVILTGITSINGGDGDDTIIGSAANDTILGGSGNDILSGGIGDDILTGGVGADTMTGGAGNDTFLDKIANFNGDTILDFSLGDTIDFTNVKNPSALVLSYDAGVLTITGPGTGKDGVHINMAGSFTTSSFEVVSDGHNGSMIHLIA